VKAAAAAFRRALPVLSWLPALIAATVLAVHLPASLAHPARARSVENAESQLVALQSRSATLAVQEAALRTTLDGARSDNRVLSTGIRTHAKQIVTQARTLGRSRPNLILIVTDDQRWDTLWSMPNVKSLLAAHGVTFTNAFVTTSLCCPSRSSIFTGQYSRHTGVYDNRPPNGGAPAFHDGSTLVTWLHGAGYRTGLFGKYLNDYSLLQPGYIPPGWDEWNAIAMKPQARYYDYLLNENGRLVRHGDGPEDYSTDVFAQKVVQFIRGSKKPFFAYVAPMAPHVPSTPAPGDVGRFSDLAPFHPPAFNEADVTDKPWGDRYQPLSASEQAGIGLGREHMLESLQSVDRAVARIVSAVEAKGQLDNTIIAFTSDNGYLWGEHRLVRKIWPYEESIRVPMVIRVPWVGSPGTTDSHLVANIDLAPTFAQLALASPGLPQDGLSLVPLLEGKHIPWRHAFVVELLADHPGSLVYSPPYEGVRTERYLYVEYRNGWRELYDLRADPHQMTNRAGDPAYGRVEGALARQLARLLT
jgi:N-acetylglucosamine-6-sulfatase